MHLVFEHGSFTQADTMATATALLCYAVGLWAFAGVRIIVSAFYSLQDTKTPAVTAGIAVGANILLSLWLMSLLDAAGLALATALASILNGGILVAVLHRRLGRVEWGSILSSACRVLGVCVPVIVICFWVASASMWMESGKWIVKSAVLFAGIGSSVIVYLGVHIMLGSEELDVVMGMVKRKFGRVARKFGVA